MLHQVVGLPTCHKHRSFGVTGGQPASIEGCPTNTTCSCNHCCKMTVHLLLVPTCTDRQYSTAVGLPKQVMSSAPITCIVSLEHTGCMCSLRCHSHRLAIMARGDAGILSMTMPQASDSKSLQRFSLHTQQPTVITQTRFCCLASCSPCPAACTCCPALLHTHASQLIVVQPFRIICCACCSRAIPCRQRRSCCCCNSSCTARSRRRC